MTYQRLALDCSASVYRKDNVEDTRILWTGEVEHIQFEVSFYKPLKVLVVAFAGSNELKDFGRHVFVRRKQGVHRGWLKDWQRVRSTVAAVVNEHLDKAEVVLITGHSYGGSLAQQAARWLAERIGGQRILLYTFGAPRLGNKKFAQSLNDLIPMHFRYTVANDPVPHLPFGIRYKHAGVHQKLKHGWPGHSIHTYEELLK